MSIITKEFHSFFKDLAKNNNRDWFHANKKRYETGVKEPFKELVSELISQTQKFDPEVQIEPKEGIFRINRDIRFSKDKTPYKTYSSAIISKYGRKGKDYPGYYLHLSPGELSIGGGAYFLEKGDLQKVRQYISDHPKEFAKVYKNKKFVGLFETIKGEQNKRLPKEFQAPAEKEPLIANKQFYFMTNIDPKMSLEKDFVKFVINHFKTGKILNDFLLKALS